MKKQSRGFSLAFLLLMQAALFVSLGGVPAANAALNPPAQAVAPLDPVTGFPTFYQDKNGLALKLCTDQNQKCIMTPADPTAVPPIPNFDPFFGAFTQILPNNPALPQVPASLTPQNFPIEIFYWMADSGAAKTSLLATGATGAAGKFRITMSLSAGFATLNPPGAVQNGQQTVMLRINIFKMLSGLVPNSPYVITTPYGVINLTSDANGGFSGGVGGQGFRNLLGGAAALNFTAVMPASIPAAPGQPAALLMDDFLVCQAGAPAGYIGDPLVGCTVGKASTPAVQQVVNISGPGLPAAGVDVTQFGVCGKKFGMDIAPAALDLGKIPMATPPATTTASPVKTFTITNVNAVSNMILTSVTIGGANAADFAIDPATTTCAANTSLLAAANPPVAGSSCTVGVKFLPLPLGPAAPEVALRKATITIPATFPLPAGAVPPPDGVIPLTGTAQLSMAATAGANGTITPQGTGLFVDAGTTNNFTIQPNAKFMVKDITVNGALAHFNPPSAVGGSVTFTAPAANINGQAINTTFMPSGDLDASGTLDIADALKGLRILVGLQAPAADDQAAMKVFPLDATGRPNGTGAPDLNDVVLILKRVLNLITW